MGWVCEKCSISVLSGGAKCPACNDHRPGYKPSCYNCGKYNDSVRYIETDKDPIPLCIECCEPFPL
jgi:hypothetical protein